MQVDDERSPVFPTNDGGDTRVPVGSLIPGDIDGIVSRVNLTPQRVDDAELESGMNLVGIVDIPHHKGIAENESTALGSVDVVLKGEALLAVMRIVWIIVSKSVRRGKTRWHGAEAVAGDGVESGRPDVPVGVQVGIPEVVMGCRIAGAVVIEVAAPPA